VDGLNETIIIFFKRFFDGSCWGLRWRWQNRRGLHLRLLFLLFFLVKQILLLRRCRRRWLEYWLLILFIVLKCWFLLLYRWHGWGW
jgi:hypothetical protein